MQTNTRMLVEGAIFTSIFLILIFISAYSPLLGSLTLLIAPLPFVVYIYRNDIRYGIIVGISSFVLSLTFIPLYGLISSMIAIFAGTVMGILLKKSYPSNKTILIVALAFIVEAVSLQYLARTAFGHNYLHEIDVLVDDLIKMVPFFKSSLSTAKEVIYQLIYALLVLFGICSSYVLYAVTYLLFTKIGYKIDPMKNIFDVKLNKVWAFIAVMFYLVESYINIPTGLNSLVVNLNFLFKLSFVLNGLSVIIFTTALLTENRLIRLPIIFMVIYKPILLVTVAIGISAAIVDLKKIIYFQIRKIMLKYKSLKL